MASTVWEHPDQLGINSIIDSAPACVYEALESTGVTTMHHYFWDYPLLILCPLRHQHTLHAGIQETYELYSQQMKNA